MKNENKKSWIVGTGFSRGIGAQLAKYFHEYGYRVFHVGRTKGQHDDEFLHWDLAKPISETFINELQSRLEPKNLDGFLYGAGIIPELVCEDTPKKKVEFWNSQKTAMQVNFFSCVSFADEVLHALLKNKNLSNPPFIAHISSLAAVDPFPGFEIYGITKAAALRYFEYLSKQYDKTQLLSLAIHPGIVQTDMLDNLIKDEKYQQLPIVNAFKEAQKNNLIISSDESAKLISKFLCDRSHQKLRDLSHGKLYQADNSQIY